MSDADRLLLEGELIAEICGFGPLDPLFADPTVSDILVNGPAEVWVDRFGRLERTAVRFDDAAHLSRLLGRLVATHGRNLDEASPSVDVRLSDGSRLHAVIPPLSRAPVVSIRRLRVIPFRPEELCACGTLSEELVEFLGAVVRARLNLLVSGGAASGKTTLLNVLARFIPPGERVVTIEETAELRFDHPHVVALEARLPNVEGRGEVTLRSLVRNSLRMRPDRIIVGEVRGPEVFDMLQAMNTGHEGSLTTVHANSPEDALRRLENLVLLGGFGLSSESIRELLAATLHVIVHLQRFPDGTRRITSVREVRRGDTGLNTVELFRFSGPDGGHSATDQQPSFAERLS
jgi:pilus assembly protein CpaF